MAQFAFCRNTRFASQAICHRQCDCFHFDEFFLLAICTQRFCFCFCNLIEENVRVQPWAQPIPRAQPSDMKTIWLKASRLIRFGIAFFCVTRQRQAAAVMGPLAIRREPTANMLSVYDSKNNWENHSWKWSEWRCKNFSSFMIDVHIVQQKSLSVY